jgi:hypothetical protein
METSTSSAASPSAANGVVNKAGIPFHPTSSNYQSAQSEASDHSTPIKIPDGRRNSQGEILPSPTESWKPNLQRTQSWNAEDLKRVYYKRDMQDGSHPQGQGTGFTEGGEGTRKV